MYPNCQHSIVFLAIVQEEATTKPLEKTLPNGSGKIVPGVPKDNLPEPKPEPSKIELPESKVNI